VSTLTVFPEQVFLMAEADASYPPETGDPVTNYLEALRLRHPAYPDCCTYHVQYEILSEHIDLLRDDVVPLED